MHVEKKRKPSVKVAAIICIVAFLFGNRLGKLYEIFNTTEDSAIVCFAKALDNYFKIDVLSISVSTTSTSILVGMFIAVFAIAIYMYYMTQRRNFKIGAEHGDSRYGSAKEAAVLRDKTPDNNMILSNTIWLSVNTRMTFLNNNVMVIGGSGSGKTRYMVKPNAMQLNCSYLFTDPKGGLVKEYGQFYLDNKYDLKVIDLIDMSKSMHYNPLHYCKSPHDVMKVLNNIMTNTKDQTKKGGDDFWDKASLALLMALTFFVMGTGTKEDKNIPVVLGLLDYCNASEEDENAMSPMDCIFQELQEEVDAKLQCGDHTMVLACKNSYEYLACRQYSLYKKAAGKTAKSILITLGSQLSIFNLPSVDEFLRDDEVHLETIGNPKILDHEEDKPVYQKTALFICTSDSDSTFNFLASIMYQQLFDMLYAQADLRDDGRLPVHVKAILDEFANIGKIPDFEIKIATMRSREISVMILLQNLSQLKGMYQEEKWETIYGNCDTTIFLGGKEFSTLEYLSKNIGNTTIDYMSVSETKGSNGSWSRSNQLIQRPLLAPDEIKRLPKNECLVDIRGEYIFRDKKCNLTSHKRYKETADFDKNKFLNVAKYVEEFRTSNTYEDIWVEPYKQKLPDDVNFDITDFSERMNNYYQTKG